jgi:broad specificity phosphatase PhoE
MTAGVLFVRHAMPEQREGQAPSAWGLGPVGRAAAAELAGHLDRRPEVTAVVASDEAKAWETAEPIAARFGLAVERDERLGEVSRPWVGADYRAVAHRYVDGEELSGWEPHGQVADRMAAAVEDAQQRAAAAAGPSSGAARCVVVGHGLALTVFMASLLPAGFDAGGFWRRLAFPDAWMVDPTDLVVVRLGAGGRRADPWPREGPRGGLVAG